MTIGTQNELQEVFNNTNFCDSESPITWEGIRWSEVDGKPYPYIGEAACLGDSCVQLCNDNENSNWDHFFIGELARLFAAGKLKIIP